MRSEAEVEWLERAECRKPGVDPEIFFPSSSKASDSLPALMVCAVCPVRTECRERTLRIDQEIGSTKIFGVSGGLTEEVRIRRCRVARSQSQSLPVCKGVETVFASSQRGFAPEGGVRLEREGMCFQCWNKSKKEGEGSR